MILQLDFRFLTGDRGQLPTWMWFSTPVLCHWGHFLQHLLQPVDSSYTIYLPLMLVGWPSSWMLPWGTCSDQPCASRVTKEVLVAQMIKKKKKNSTCNAKGCESRSAISDSLQPHGQWPTRLLSPWGFPRQEYWSGLPFPSPGIFLPRGSNPGLLHCRQILTVWATREAHNTEDLGSIPWFGKIPWRREWQPTPVSLPGEFQGQRSLAGYSSWGSWL